MQETIFHYGRVGFTFDVYSNRIEITDKSGFGGFFTGGKKESILFRNITAVDVQGATRKLSITTSDGKVRQYILGTKSEEARQTIVALL
jgi:hypothetical protein